jgi:SAM-dependent methyltransferase
MPESDQFWDFYWEMRLQELQNLGKRAAILAASRVIRKLAEGGRGVRMLELGCGEGQIIGSLVEGHQQVPGIGTSVGVDYIHQSILTCRARYPMMKFVEGDFTESGLLDELGSFDLLLLVNALHEVFTAGFSNRLGEIDVPTAKERVESTLAKAVGCLKPGGWVVLFDGLETSGDISEMVRVRFRSSQARNHFRTFAREYHPFKITFRETGDPRCIELSRRDFTRYITKSIFLGKALWQTERLESYQYYNQAEFRAAVVKAGLAIRELRTLTVDEEKWHNQVQIETPGVNFPEEHILIIGQKTAAE